MAYPEEIKQAAIKAYYSGVSGRDVGHLFHMNKANVYNWIKKRNNFVKNAPYAKLYCTDGYVGYLDVVYLGVHIRNIHDRSDTFTVEGVNADLRHYIPLLARRSRCFPRSLETLKAVLSVFTDAYNRFHLAVFNFRLHSSNREFPLGLVDFL